jgi:AcrR family transcriptional regulator
MTRKKVGKKRGGPGRLSADEAAKVTDRLLDAALELFNSQGYGRTSMEQIARAAGASTKTLYARFPDREAVVEAVVNRIVEGPMASVAAATADQDPRAFLIATGVEMVTNISTSGAGLIRAALSEARRIPAIGVRYNAVLTRGRANYRRALEQWQKAGLLPALKDPEMGAILLLSMLSDMARIKTAMGDPMTKSEIAAYIPYATDIFLRGCGYTFG